MVISVRVAGDARVEAAEAASWYEEKQEGLGERFLLDARRTVELLATSQGRPLRDFSHLGVRTLAMRGRWPYRVFFVDRAERVVIAFAHNRRAPGYWLGRLTEEAEAG
jgi:hypothetical protein